MSSSADTDAAVALGRFGLGARPGEIDRIAGGPKDWLLSQIRPGGAPGPTGDFVDSAARMQQLLSYRQTAQQGRMAPPAASAPADAASADPGAERAREATQAERRALTQDTAREFLARARFGAATDEGFAERWALFWANAFTASATKFQSAVLMGQYEREAIRPHVFGRFEDLALAAEQHPAMLLYLDQAQSVGPNSRAGRRRDAGLNENLAREIMELHTVGADGGYGQADVTEFARALTGWSVATPRDRAAAGEPGANGFVYRAVVH